MNTKRIEWFVSASLELHGSVAKVVKLHFFQAYHCDAARELEEAKKDNESPAAVALITRRCEKLQETHGSTQYLDPIHNRTFSVTMQKNHDGGGWYALHVVHADFHKTVIKALEKLCVVANDHNADAITCIDKLHAKPTRWIGEPVYSYIPCDSLNVGLATLA